MDLQNSLQNELRKVCEERDKLHIALQEKKLEKDNAEEIMHSNILLNIELNEKYR